MGARWGAGWWEARFGAGCDAVEGGARARRGYFAAGCVRVRGVGGEGRERARVGVRSDGVRYGRGRGGRGGVGEGGWGGRGDGEGCSAVRVVGLGRCMV